MAKGEAPIEKNVTVVDEQGNEYEATWPKRARGLVKNGRARFISDNKICLACPPNIVLEDNRMTNIMENGTDERLGRESGVDKKITHHRAYLLGQMNKILEEKDYLYRALETLEKMGDGDNGQAYGPGNTLGQAKANAIKDIVCHRETMNQQLLKIYEKMYYEESSKSILEHESMDCRGKAANDPEMDEKEKQRYGQVIEQQVIEQVVCALKND